MSLSIVTGVIGRNEVTRRFLDATIFNCDDPHELIIVSNGSTPEEVYRLKEMVWGGTNGEPPHPAIEGGWDVRVLDYPHPLGISKAFNVGVSEATGDHLAVLQSDLLITTPGWDRELERYLDCLPRAGVLGLAGAKQIGALDIYHTPYHFTQLGRAQVWTSLEEWQPHGYLCGAPVRVAVLDGIAQCFDRKVWQDVGGFDERYFHHCYDNDFGIMAHYAGFMNYVVPLRCIHLGGQTVNHAEAYREAIAADYGDDLGVHQRSHVLMYEKWHGRLPLVVP